MAYYKMPSLYNPFGVLYNPASISRNFRILIEGRLFSANDLHFSDGLWLSLDHHTTFSDPDKRKTLEKINSSLSDAVTFLKKSSYLFLTFGTAWIYIYRKSGTVAANCHKIRQSEFERRLLQPEEIIKDYTGLLNELRDFNPDLNVIFTISPIRHFKDGAFYNQVSKSVLFLAVHSLLQRFDFTSYFPAYEIFMDELRDYRFYTDDMLHPSSQGVSYVWERFCEAYLDGSSKEIMSSVEKIRRAASHRPFRTETTEYKKFVTTILSQIEQIQKRHPFLNFEEEVKKLTSSI